MDDCINRSTYSIGFDVMALVVQRVTGLGYSEFLQRRIFGPLDMTSTGSQVQAADATRLTTNDDATPSGNDTATGAQPDRLQ